MGRLGNPYPLVVAVLLFNAACLQCRPLDGQGKEALTDGVGQRRLQQTKCQTWTCPAQAKLWRAVIGGKPDDIKTAVFQGASINLMYGGGWTVLHVAADYGNADVGKELIALGANKNAGNENGTTPLHMAANHGFAAFVSMLLAQGANKDARDSLRFTPLHLASFGHGYQKYDVADVKGISQMPAAEDGDIQRVRLAPFADHLMVARLLLDSRADPMAKTIYQETPLHYVSTWDRWRICQTLIDYGADVDAVDVQGETPLHEAVAYAATGVTQVLVTHMANTYIKEEHGLTPREFICRCRLYTGDPTLNPCAPQKCISGEDRELMESFIDDARNHRG